jgi:site-specific recombinase XerD
MIEFFRPQPQDLLPLCSGPLAPHLNSFAALLAQQGYGRSYGWQKVRLVADLSQWLAKRRLKLEGFDERQATDFLEARYKTRSRAWGDASTLIVLLRHLREIGAIPARQSSVLRGFADILERDYEQFLLQERGLVPGTVAVYLPVVQRFLEHRFPTGKIQLRQLRAGDAAGFILHASAEHRRGYLQLATSALRSFLGFLLQRGRIATPLASAVPTVAGRRLSEWPRFLEAAQVEKLLRSCDRRRSVGRRDHAILLLLARLGLRAGEVVHLCLEDIDWSAGELRLRGKGARLDRLPLPHDVGQAMADYLKTRRTGEACRRVFLRSIAPYAGLASSCTVAGVVRRALARADLHPHHQGAHLLRHSLATRMLRGGASLAQIGQVLRHQQAQSTEIYAKVDLKALRLLAQPWPGGVR